VTGTPATLPAADVSAVMGALSTLPQFAGRSPSLQRLLGGLTNRNYVVSLGPEKQYVARCAGAKTSLLAIDRAAEYHNSRTAAELGIGPPVVAYFPDAQILLVEWINGRTFDDSDMDDPETLTRVAGACRKLHSGGRFVNDFDMFEIQRRYLDIVESRGFRLPADYADFEPQVRRIESVLRASAAPAVPCHNDLLAANIMDSDGRIWFIDYEYAGNNDPCFELGNIWSEASLEPDRLEHLVDSYYGTATPGQTARARLFALMSKYGWTLWASIQDAVSTVEFDFWQWGMDKYDRAIAEFRSPDFDTWIDAIQQSLRPEGATP
jgi:thiamine kinase-like enzyme